MIINRLFRSKLSHLLPKFKLQNMINYNFATLMKLPEQIPIFAIRQDNLRDNEGSREKKVRIGRGPGSSKGKTSGRGMKGMKARTGGGVRPTQEGGQSNIMRRLPKVGRVNKAFKKPYAYININKVLYYIKKELINPQKIITIKDLFDAGAISKAKYGVKLLGSGGEALKNMPPLNIEVSSATKGAIDSIKNAGGSVIIKYRTELTLRYHIKPYKFNNQIVDPIPPFKKVKELMRLHENKAEVDFVQPRWMEGNMSYLKERMQKFKEGLKKGKNAEFLAEYPAPRLPNQGDNVIRKRRKIVFKRYNFDDKKH